MIITRVYTTDGKLLREYPDAFAHSGSNCRYIFDVDLADDKREKDEKGYPIPRKKFDVNDGNWIACISGPAIVIEEKQDETNR